MNISIFPPDELLECDITLPLSKSVSNRALLINALTPDALPLGDVAQCQDTEAMIAALASTSPVINIGAAGTTMRFLTAYFASQPGREVTLDGSERMRKRPISPLVEALRALGADIAYAGDEGFPPLHIKGRQLAGGSVDIDASVSSQYISALLMVAPLMRDGLELRLRGNVASRPYIDMTLKLMSHWGVDCECIQGVREGLTIKVPHSQYQPASYTVEADWSAASYWYEIEALTSGWVTLRGLQQQSVQGDSFVAKIFANLGVDSAFSVDDDDCEVLELSANPDAVPRLAIDLADNPDLAQTVIVTCSLMGIPFSVTGLATLKIKETDRLQALYDELLKIGVVIDITHDSASWEGRRRPINQLPEFDTYQDHRMAMSLAPVALYIPGIVIRDCEVVAKSYPDFWQHLIDAGFKIVDTDNMPKVEEASDE